MFLSRQNSLLFICDDQLALTPFGVMCILLPRVAATVR
jgi:hypothetical protein